MGPCVVCERRYALMRARRSFNYRKRTTNGPQAARLDVCAHIRREPHGGIFRQSTFLLRLPVLKSLPWFCKFHEEVYSAHTSVNRLFKGIGSNRVCGLSIRPIRGQKAGRARANCASSYSNWPTPWMRLAEREKMNAYVFKSNYSCQEVAIKQTWRRHN